MVLSSIRFKKNATQLCHLLHLWEVGVTDDWWKEFLSPWSLHENLQSVNLAGSSGHGALASTCQNARRNGRLSRKNFLKWVFIRQEGCHECILDLPCLWLAIIAQLWVPIGQPVLHTWATCRQLYVWPGPVEWAQSYFTGLGKPSMKKNGIFNDIDQNNILPHPPWPINDKYNHD